MGDMVADAILAAHPDYDFAVTNSGGLRQDIDTGIVTVGRVNFGFSLPEYDYSTGNEGQRYAADF